MAARHHPESGADVVIVGGGITGCATAWHLARRGVDVLVLEKGDVACEQSSRAWGFVRQQGRHAAEIPLAREANRVWKELDSELGTETEFMRGGVLALAADDRDARKLKASARVASEHGLNSRLVNRREIEVIVPELRGPWTVGLYTEEDGHADPAKATRALAAAARRAGARIQTSTRVIDVLAPGNRVTGVQTDQGFLRADALILAAGIHGARFARALGVTVPLRIGRSSVAETNSAPLFTRTAVWSPHVALRPTPRGSFYLGNGYAVSGAEHDITLGSFNHLLKFLPSYIANWRRLKLNLGREFFEDLLRRMRRETEDQALGEPRVNERKIAYNEQRFYDLFPHLRGLGIARTWAGRIDMTADMIPVLGPASGVEGVLLAFGFSGHGFALGPVIGRVLCELIVDGRTEFDISAFDPRRFEKSTIRIAKDTL